MKIQCISDNDFSYMEKESSKNILEQIEVWANGNNVEKPRLNDGSVIVFAKEEDEIIGFLQFYHYSKAKEFYVSWAFVQQQYRGHGVFSKMFKYVKSFAKLYNCDKITSYILKDNFISKAVHKKLGFKEGTDMYLKLPLKEYDRFDGFIFRMDN